MTPRYTVQPLYRIIDSTTGEPVGEPCPQSDAEVTANALNAAEAAKDKPRRWLFAYDPRGGDHLSIYGNAILSGPGTARELRITPELVERLNKIYWKKDAGQYFNPGGIRAVLEEFLKV